MEVVASVMFYDLPNLVALISGCSNPHTQHSRNLRAEECVSLLVISRLPDSHKRQQS